MPEDPIPLVLLEPEKGAKNYLIAERVGRFFVASSLLSAVTRVRPYTMAVANRIRSARMMWGSTKRFFIEDTYYSTMVIDHCQIVPFGALG